MLGLNDFRLRKPCLVSIILTAMPHSMRRENKRANDLENDQSYVLRLPLELLLAISDYLSPTDGACFALSCPILLKALGLQRWPSLNPGKKRDETEIELFLKTLTRDLPHRFFCHSCNRLHPRGRLRAPGPLFRRREEHLQCLGDYGTALPCSFGNPNHSFYSFSFKHLQLVMEKYHYGFDHGIPAESLSFTEVSVPTDGIHETGDGVARLLSVEARICPRPVGLYLRVQHWLFVNTTNHDEILAQSDGMWLCDHIPDFTLSFRRSVEHILATSSGETLKCTLCNMDYEIRLRDFPGEGSALVITKWLDLGAGLTPYDPRWRAHVSYPRMGVRAFLSNAGDVQARFESEYQPEGRGQTQEALTDLNAWYLSRKRFKKVMHPWTCGTWVLQGEQ